jgi:hypothetical protein
MDPQIYEGDQQDSRLEDYLNDRLQTPADLEGIDRLLVRAKEQQGLLKSQVRTKTSNLSPFTALILPLSSPKPRLLFNRLLKNPSNMKMPFESMRGNLTSSRRTSTYACLLSLSLRRAMKLWASSNLA